MKPKVFDFWVDNKNFNDNNNPIHNPFSMADFVMFDCIVIICFSNFYKSTKKLLYYKL